MLNFILEKTLVGVKVFLHGIDIRGTNIKGSVVSELLKDATTTSGLICDDNHASFVVGDTELVFESLVSVRYIQLRGNHDSAQRFTAVSFPALEFVGGSLSLHGNEMLKTISMPNLVGVGDSAYFYSNLVLSSLRLPSLVAVGSTFSIEGNPSLATNKVQVSKDFESLGSSFIARFMMSGFQCTAENGLRAVVAKAGNTNSQNVVTGAS